MVFNILYGLFVLSSYCTSSISNFFTSAPNVWFSIVLIASMMIMSIVAIIYIISPLIGRNDIRVWARAKVYDAVITIIFALIFLSISTTICAVNPVPAFASIGLVPDSCNSASAGAASAIPNPSNVGDIFGLSLCELYQFNQNVVTFSESIFWLAVPFGLAPQVTYQLTALPSINPLSGKASGFGITVPVNLLPIIIVHQYIVPYMQIYFTAVILSQVQQILLSASMFIFTIFMVIGLVARSFGVTKSFGGAMIAFALGLGIIYPIMITMSYGFLDTVIQNTGTTIHTPLNSLPNAMVVGAEGILAVLFSSFLPGAQATLQTLLYPLVLYGGFVAAGLVIIPLLNLLVVDAFIVDFSKSIGERMDLFSLLTRII